MPEFYKEEFVEMVEFSLAAIYERVTPSAMELCHYLENQLRCNKEGEDKCVHVLIMHKISYERIFFDDFEIFLKAQIETFSYSYTSTGNTYLSERLSL